MSSNPTINIAFATDDNYVMPVVVAMTSLFENNPYEIDIYLLSIEGCLSDQNRSILRDTVEKYGSNIHFADVSTDRFDGLPVFRHGHTAYLRLFSSEIFPHLDKLLYLDCDIVVEGSVKELYETNIDDYTLAGVAEQRTENIAYNKMIGFNYTHRYYINSGVLLMNLKALRKLNLKQLTSDYLAVYKDVIRLVDQDIINCIFPDILMLHPKYNALPISWNLNSSVRGRLWSKEEINETAQRPVVIHYITSKKPWVLKCRHVLTDRWFHYLKLTQFSGYRVPVKPRELPIFILRNLHIFGKKIVKAILILRLKRCFYSQKNIN